MHWIKSYYYSIERYGIPSDRAALLSVLDEDEQMRFERYRFDHSRWAFATARWILKTHLAIELGRAASDIHFSYSELGKPSLADDEDMHFSLSHSERSIFLAISNREVGVDVESLERRGEPWNNADAYLNDYAAEIIHSQTTEALKQCCFARYWCGMEALVKLTGGSVFHMKNHFGKTLKPLIDDGNYCDDRNEWRMKKVGTKEYSSLVSPLGLEGLKEFEFNGSDFV